MADQNVALLNPRCVVGGDADAVVHGIPELTAGAASQSNGVKSEFTSGSQSVQNVRGVSAGRDSNGDIARIPQGLDLPREDMVEAVVVTNCGDAGAVNGQS